MCEDEEKGRVKVSGIFSIKFQLAPEVVPRVIQGMNFVHPERFLVKVVEPQSNTEEETDKNDKPFLLSLDI